MKKIAVTVLAAAAVLALAAPAAPAQTYRTATCKAGTSDGVRVEVTAMGRTSCALALAGTRKVVRLGYAPTTLRVYSSVTHRTYTVRRDSVEHSDDYYSFVYVAPGEIAFQLQVRW